MNQAAAGVLVPRRAKASGHGGGPNQAFFQLYFGFDGGGQLRYISFIGELRK
jgi:hypothetical protein